MGAAVSEETPAAIASDDEQLRSLAELLLDASRSGAWPDPAPAGISESSVATAPPSSPRAAAFASRRKRETRRSPAATYTPYWSASVRTAGSPRLG
jgi:hypothetical protein